MARKAQRDAIEKKRPEDAAKWRTRERKMKESVNVRELRQNSKIDRRLREIERRERASRDLGPRLE